MIFGVDAASWQGLIRAQGLKDEGHDFLVEKATGEGDYESPAWRANIANAIAVGLIPGTYDWVEAHLWASVQDAIASARDALRVVRSFGKLVKGWLLCVDFESPLWATGPLGTNIEAAFRAYMETLRDEGFGKVILYSGKYFLEETGASRWSWLTEANGFYFWQAAPGPGMMADDSFWPATPPPFAGTTIHQHQWYARSPAIDGEYDRDRFRGTREELMALGAPSEAGEIQEGGEVQIPAEGKYTAYVDPASGAAIFVWNMGGKVGPGGILGINVQDLGMTVDSATEPGTPIDRSIQGQEVKPFHDRRQDAGATQRPVGAPGQVEGTTAPG